MIETMPGWVLALVYWLHMVATVTWIGGLTALAWVVLPAAQRSLNPDAYQKLLADFRPRLQRLGWFSLAVLTVTGMFQMSAHPAYQGFLAITNSWAVAILLKHIVIGGLVVISAYLTWGLVPALQRLALLQAAGADTPSGQVERLQRVERRLLNLSLLLSLVILAFTALARAA